MTEKERKILTKIEQLEKNYWPQFLKQTFPGFSLDNASCINELDWKVVMFNQKNPALYVDTFTIHGLCQESPNISCLELIIQLALNGESFEEIEKPAMEVENLLRAADFTAAFKGFLTTLWHAKLPCFDTLGMSLEEDGERGILKSCSWKGESVPCSKIFTTFPTDQGMCCSFNMKAANEIFSNSQYSALVTQLQKEDLNISVDNGTLPSFYLTKQEPKTQSGRSMGLKLVLDAHTDIVESISISQDFEGFTGLITEPGNFPLANLRGFEVMPGHNNLVALSAVKIDADEDLRGLKPETRKCLFPDEIEHLKLFKSYKQSNCFLECALKYAQKENDTQGCTPWYFPFVDENFKLCDPYQTMIIRKAMQNVPDGECNYCLPDCIRTIYKHSVTTQPFRRCDERNWNLSDLCKIDTEVKKPQIWGRQFIEQFNRKNITIPASFVESSKRTIKKSYLLSNFFEDLPAEYDAYEKDIAVLTVFFDSTTVMKYKSQRRQSWLDYLSSVGGALGLCIGLSIITIIEIFWLCVRLAGLCNSKNRNPDQVVPFTGEDKRETIRSNKKLNI